MHFGLIVALALVPALAGAEPIREGFSQGLFAWTRVGQRVTVVAQPVNDNGTLAICGAWTVSSPAARTTGLNEQVLQSGRIEIDGETVLRNLRFLPFRPDVESWIGVTTACKRTGRDWRPDDEGAALRFVFPRQRFRGG
ncbi:MAG: hypothetical protein AAF698_06100 [Pseudomonadota bacterium]